MTTEILSVTIVVRLEQYWMNYWSRHSTVETSLRNETGIEALYYKHRYNDNSSLCQIWFKKMMHEWAGLQPFCPMASNNRLKLYYLQDQSDISPQDTQRTIKPTTALTSARFARPIGAAFNDRWPLPQQLSRL